MVVIKTTCQFNIRKCKDKSKAYTQGYNLFINLHLTFIHMWIYIVRPH